MESGNGGLLRWVYPGDVEAYKTNGIALVPLFVEIRTEKRDQGRSLRLCITGVVGPRSDGDAWGGCGQCVDELRGLRRLAAGWTAEQAARLREVWERWHLNDMRAGCEHQRAEPERWRMCPGHYLPLSQRVRFIDETDGSGLVHIARTRATIPANCEGQEETRILDAYIAGQFYEGSVRCSLDKLSQPCPVCGYRYGSSWLYEEVPSDVLAWLQALPDARGLVPTRWLRRS